MEPTPPADPIEALLHPFRRLAGEPAMSDARQDWRERRRITGTIAGLGLKIDSLLDALHWSTRNPADGNEEDARKPLADFRTAVCALFSIELPLYTEPATTTSTHKNQDTQGPGER